MRTTSWLLLTLRLLLLLLSPGAIAEPEGEDALAPLAPFVGKTWRGELAGSSAEEPRIDVSHWEWALNGKAVRILHSVNDGAYGGESLIFEDPEGEGLMFFYVTTAGFYTEGTLTFEDGKFISHEKVTGSVEGGVTQVKAVGEILPDGRLRSTSRYLKDGEWVEGHSATYVEDPSAEVVFGRPR